MHGSELIRRYDQMWDAGWSALSVGTCNLDSLIDDPLDTRRGLTLRYRLNTRLLNQFCSFGKKLRDCFPKQYYYAGDEIHMTVLSIVSAERGFKLDEKELPIHLKLIEEVLSHTAPFQIQFEGVTLSGTGPLIQGYLLSSELDELRNNLRNIYANTDVFSSIDKRYPIETAHVSLMRYIEKVDFSNDLQEVLKALREEQFGSGLVDSVELVYNDWYHSSSKTRVLKTFKLKG
ncbi:MAG: 2'-5' RNA ligase family protein [Reichenbachiella sp.]